jgi:hypothetical protein
VHVDFLEGIQLQLFAEDNFDEHPSVFVRFSRAWFEREQLRYSGDVVVEYRDYGEHHSRVFGVLHASLASADPPASPQAASKSSVSSSSASASASSSPSSARPSGAAGSGRGRGAASRRGRGEGGGERQRFAVPHFTEVEICFRRPPLDFYMYRNQRVKIRALRLLFFRVSELFVSPFEIPRCNFSWKGIVGQFPPPEICSSSCSRCLARL